METNRLRQFCAVAETLNLRKSAELLHVTHSALSKSLKVLQTEIGLQLFVPVGRQLALTDAGREFYQRAKVFLQQEAVLLQVSTEASPPVRIGTFEVFSTHVLASLFPRHFPDANFELHELLPGKLELALMQRKVDFGITYEPIPTEGVEFIRVARTRMSVVARRGAFSRMPLAGIPFAAPISPIEGTPTGNKGLDGWPEDRVRRSVRFRVDMLETALVLAREGKAAIFIPSFMLEYVNRHLLPAHQLVELEMPSALRSIHRNLYLLHRQATPESPTLRTLAKLLRSL